MKEQKLFRRYGVSLALAVVGGFLEAYTYVTRDGVFANAQTGNIARMGLNLAQGNVLLTLRYLIPVIAFMAGVTLSLQLRRLRQDWERIILLLEIVLLFLVGLIPAHKLSILGGELSQIRRACRRLHHVHRQSAHRHRASEPIFFRKGPRCSGHGPAVLRH